MTWTNTRYRPNMGLFSSVQSFNQHQAATGSPQIPEYPCHVHVAYWVEKMTQDELIGRNMCRSIEPAGCVLGSRAKLLFLRTHQLGNVYADPHYLSDRAAWHEGQIFRLDEPESSQLVSAQRELVLMCAHPAQARAIQHPC